MAKIVINKNFQKRYLFKAYERLLKNDYGVNYRYCTPYTGSVNPFQDNGNKKMYLDLSTYQTQSTQIDGKISNIFLCTETTLNVFNKINNSLKNLNSLPKIYGDLTLDVLKLTNSLYSQSKVVRDGAISYFESANIITEEESQFMKNNFYCLYPDSLILDDIVDKLTLLEDNILNFSIDKPLNLSEIYKLSNNPMSEQLYLIIFPFNDTKFVNNIQDITIQSYFNQSNEGIYPVGFTRMYKKDTNTSEFQIPYLAFSLSEENGGGDIEYDHLDEIEYLDNIKLSLELPKQYS